VRHIKEQKKKYIDNYKLKKGCAECGYNELPECLDFDHVDRTQKKFKLSRGFKYSWKAIEEELSKCVVLCAMCHRKKTHREKDYLNFNQLEINKDQNLYEQLDFFEEFEYES